MNDVGHLLAALRKRNKAGRFRALEQLERAGEPGPVPPDVVPELVGILAKKVRRNDTYWLCRRLAMTLLRIGRSSPQEEENVRNELARANLGPKIDHVDWILENLGTRVPRLYHEWTGPKGDRRWVHTYYGLFTWKVRARYPDEEPCFQTVDDFMQEGVASDVIAQVGRRGVPDGVLDAIHEALGTSRPPDTAFKRCLEDVRRLIELLRAAKQASHDAPCITCGSAPVPERLAPLVDVAGATWLRCRECGALFRHYQWSEWMGFERDEGESLGRGDIAELACELDHACDYDRGFTIHWEAAADPP